MSDAISTEIKQTCECCTQRKICRMYVLQTGEAAWICLKCRGEPTGPDIDRQPERKKPIKSHRRGYGHE